MADETNNCPSCDDHPMGEPLPGNPNVLVRPYVPPTDAELELSNNFYAGMKARAGHDPGASMPIQAPAPAREPILTADLLRRLNAGEAVRLRDTSGLVMDPNGPAATSRRESTLACENARRAMALPRSHGGAENGMLDTDVATPSQLTAPWFSHFPHPLAGPAVQTGRMVDTLNRGDA